MATNSTGVDVGKAIEIATAAVHEYYDGDEISGIRLEEVEFVDESNLWLITLGFMMAEAPERTSAFKESMKSITEAGVKTRVYKVFAIDSMTGKVLSMKIRKP